MCVNPSIDFILGCKSTYFLLHIIAIHISYLAFFSAFLSALLYLIQDNNLKNKKLNSMFSRLPDLSVLDRWNYISIGLGFPVLTLSIVGGLLWLKGIAGIYWVWNTRVIYSLVLWLLYAIILHVRLSAKMRGRKVAYLSILAFFIIVFSFFSACSSR
ncbi:MAG: cytochrome c biogenesis protein CcsA [Candidatus Omnitrophota bacterium]|nr:cytochrome c biogenesis protein CcsA [Candidatus Omnitrophota bacterium]